MFGNWLSLDLDLDVAVTVCIYSFSLSLFTSLSSVIIIILTCNVDLYVANHESADLLYEEQVGDALSTLNESGQDFVQLRSLSLD